MDPMTEISELRGELLAFRAFLAALLEVQPLSTQLRLAAKLETRVLLLRPCQPTDQQAGFDRALKSLGIRRRCSGQPGMGTDGALRQ